MDAATLSIHWHDNNQPIYSVHIQPQVHHKTIGSSGIGIGIGSGSPSLVGGSASPSNGNKKKIGPVARLATGGGDNNVRVC